MQACNVLWFRIQDWPQISARRRPSSWNHWKISNRSYLDSLNMTKRLFCPNGHFRLQMIKLVYFSEWFVMEINASSDLIKSSKFTQWRKEKVQDSKNTILIGRDVLDSHTGKFRFVVYSPNFTIPRIFKLIFYCPNFSILRISDLFLYI